MKLVFLALFVSLFGLIACGGDVATDEDQMALKQIVSEGIVHIPPTRADLVRQREDTITQSQTNRLQPGGLLLCGQRKNTPNAKTAYIIATATNADGSAADVLTSPDVASNPWIFGQITAGTDGVVNDFVFDLPLNRLMVFPFAAEDAKLNAFIADEQRNISAGPGQNALFSRPPLFGFRVNQNITVRCFLSDDEVDKIDPLRRFLLWSVPGAGTSTAALASGAKSVSIYGDPAAFSSWGFNVNSLGATVFIGPFPFNASPVDIPPNATGIRFTSTAAGAIMIEERLSF